MSDATDRELQQAAADVVNGPTEVQNKAVDASSGAETLESVLERHRSEERSLQTKIANMKKTIQKADKKKKREIQQKINDLEYELRTRHEEELRKVKGEPDEFDDGISLDRLNELTLEETPVAPVPTPSGAPKAKKPNKNKLRQERRKAEMERMREEAEKEASQQVDMAALEKKAIEELLVPMRLQVREITADGHCLYNAVADQLSQRYHETATYKELRETAANYMKDHPDDFMPFLYKDNGDMFGPDDFEKYCKDMVETPVWGGQLEILALSNAKQVPIHIIQMGAPVLKVNEEQYPGKEPLKLAYHKHLYSLGAHYNSLIDINK